MKKLINILIVTVILILTVGCSSDQPVKASGKVLNVLPDRLRKEVAEANPDVVTLEYFGNHVDDYKKNTVYDLIIIKGTVTRFGLSGTGNYSVNLDNSKYSLTIYDNDANFIEGKEYIFITDDLPSLISGDISLVPLHYFCLDDEE